MPVYVLVGYLCISRGGCRHKVQRFYTSQFTSNIQMHVLLWLVSAESYMVEPHYMTYSSKLHAYEILLLQVKREYVF